MTFPHVADAWNSAMAPQEIAYSNDIYGQIEFDIWYCVLQKGIGKVVYDPQMHTPGQRRTVVSVNVSDLGGNNYKRDFIAEIPTDGWAGVTLPSIKALGVTDLHAFNGSFVHVEMVKVGEYKKSDGTTGTRTAPKVLAVYKNADECGRAAQGEATQDDWLTGPAPARNGTNGAANGTNDAERQVALTFLPAIVKTCVRGNGVDSAALDAALRGNPILAKYFNLGSPEVTQAISQALAEPAF